MAAPDSVKKDKTHLFLSMIIVGIVLMGGPYVLEHLGLTATLKKGAWLVLLITFIGILIKSAISFLTTGDFRYDKFAYELCVLVAGGFLTCASLQITSDEKLFPGLEEISFLGFLSSVSIGVVGQHRTLLLFLFLVTLVGSLFAAINVADTEKGKVSNRWTTGTFGLGALFLCTYALVLVSKG
jgi:hypothetical protein